MKQNSIKGRLTEYFAFTYFNWLIVVPFLIPWVLLRLALSPEQFQVWLLDSVFVSLFLGWWTVKVDNRFAPWFYKKMGWDKRSKNDKIVGQLQATYDQLIELKHNGQHCSTNCSYCTETRLCKRLLTGNQRVG